MVDVQHTFAICCFENAMCSRSPFTSLNFLPFGDRSMKKGPEPNCSPYEVIAKIGESAPAARVRARGTMHLYITSIGGHNHIR